jgi:hypothetical protein
MKDRLEQKGPEAPGARALGFADDRPAPDHSEIAERAAAIWRRMGSPHSCDVAIWLEAEQTLIHPGLGPDENRGVGSASAHFDSLDPTLHNCSELYGKKLTAMDGDIGHVKDFYFDDHAWAIRYVVVDTGSWLTGRLVLLSPHAFGRLELHGDTLRVNLLKSQIQASPSIATHETVSRQFEERYYRSYGWPVYWQGGEMWGMCGNPFVAGPLPRDIEVRKKLELRADRHLQSTKTVTGYSVEAVDGTIGHVRGFQVDAASWAVRGLVVEAGHWYSGREILIPPANVDRIETEGSKVVTRLSRSDL